LCGHCHIYNKKEHKNNIHDDKVNDKDDKHNYDKDDDKDDGDYKNKQMQNVCSLQ